MRHAIRTALCLVGMLCSCGTPVSDANDPEAHWHLTERLTLGVESGAPVLEFGRVANAVKLSDGRIAVADGSNMDVRLFTPDGRHEQSFGRRGSGPGEFSSLTRLTIAPGDTLIAGGSYRIARYTRDGKYVAEQRLPWTGTARPPYFVEYARRLSNGAFLLILLESSAGQPPERPLHRSGEMYLVADSSGSLIDSLGVFPALEQLSYREGAATHTAIPLFAPDTRMAIAMEYIAIGDMNADSVLLYDVEKAHRTWIRLPLDRRRISPAALEIARESACNWTASMEARQRCETDIRHLPPQSEYPVFRDIAVDSVGTVWVATYSDSAPSDSTVWLVIGSAAYAIGKAILPADFRITQIGRSYVLGIARDSLGVQRVQEFIIRR